MEDDLKPKWEYLTRVCGFDYFEVVRFPAYFSYPLDCIKTKYEYLGSKGIPLRLVQVDRVLRFGDDDFATSVAGDKDYGKSFKEYIRNENKKKAVDNEVQINYSNEPNKAPKNGTTAINNEEATHKMGINPSETDNSVKK